MKVTGRITFVKYANREFLIQAFFDQREYSSKNVLYILNDETAFIHLEYEKYPPQAIIRAISHCKINVMDTREECSIEDLIGKYNSSIKTEISEENIAEYADETPESLIETSDSELQDARKLETEDTSDDEQEESTVSDNEAKAEDTSSDEQEESTVSDNEAKAEDTSGDEQEESTVSDNEAKAEDASSDEQEESTVSDNEAKAEDTSSDEQEESTVSDNEAKAEDTSSDEQEESTVSDNEAKAEDTSSDEQEEFTVSDNEAKAEDTSGNELEENKYQKELETTFGNDPRKDGIKKVKRGRVKADYIDIPRFEDVAEKKDTFPGFVTWVGNWLNLSEYDASYFFALVMSLAKLKQEGNELNSGQIKDANVSMGESDYRRVKFSKLITSRLEEYKIKGTLLPLLATVLKYKDTFSESDNAAKKDVPMNQDSKSDYACIETMKPDGKNSDNGAKSLMGCSSFMNIVESIDRQLPVENQIEILLATMGLEKVSRILLKKAVEITVAALSMEQLDSIDSVMNNAGIDVGTKDGMKTKIRLTGWINTYNKEHRIKHMKIIDFLRELKEIFT